MQNSCLRARGVRHAAPAARRGRGGGAERRGDPRARALGAPAVAAASPSESRRASVGRRRVGAPPWAAAGELRPRRSTSQATRWRMRREFFTFLFARAAWHRLLVHQMRAATGAGPQ
ncbi:unnamed protein product [Prorocentrum cordatum]|uniref:Uncharacterized protein n=1 Tax=Prorocentrum cordatum TaxID=2364126 RepID=A0ABN9XTZ6_9DINO|nr:unnamed protein product [Polarella glacialis]